MFPSPDGPPYLLLYTPHGDVYGAAMYTTLEEGARLGDFVRKHKLKSVTGNLCTVDQLIVDYGRTFLTLERG